MERKVAVYVKGIFAGVLTEVDATHYVFRYDDVYFEDITKPAVSLTMPKDSQEYHSSFLFPIFFNMTSEGENRRIQSHLLKIDEKDDFGILLATAHTDTIGAITVKPLEE